MSDPYQNIDRLFRDNLGNHSQEPPSYVWDQISGALDKKERRRRRKFFWIFSSAVMIGIAFGIGYYISDYQADRRIADLENTIKIMTSVRSIPQTGIQNSREVPAGKTNTTQPENPAGESHNNNSSSQQNTNTRPHSQVQGKTNTVNPGTSGQSGHTAQLFNNRENGFAGNNDTDKNTGSGYSGVTGSHSHATGNGQPAVTSGNTGDPVTYGNPDRETVPVQKGPSFSLLSSRFAFAAPQRSILTMGPLKAPMNPFRRFAIEAWFGPQYVMKNSSVRDSINLYQPVFGMNVDFDERYTFSYNTGLAFGFSPVKNLSVFAGVQYSTMNFTTARDVMSVPIGAGISPDLESLPVQTSMGQLSGISYLTDAGAQGGGNPEFDAEDTKNGDTLQGIAQHFATVEIPVTVRYRVGNRFGVTFTAGVSPSFLVANDVSVIRGGVTSTVGHTEGIKSVTLNGVFGIGLDYQVIRGRLSIFADPQVRYGFVNWSRHPDVKFNPLFLSGNIGLRAWF